MQRPKLKKEYTREDLIIFGNYLLSKERAKNIKNGAHYKIDKEAIRMVHHADVENAFDLAKFNPSVLV